MVNIVGDHATYHKQFDPPLESDIESLARPVSGWYRRTGRPEDVAADAVAAVEAALGPPRKVATLVLPADVSWLEAGDRAAGDLLFEAVAENVASPFSSPQGSEVSSELVDALALVLRSGEPAALLLGGRSLRERALMAASRVAVTVGARLLSETIPGRTERGAGLPAVERLAYFGELASVQLDGLRHLVLVDSRVPVSAFAYPGLPSELLPEGCQVHVLASDSDDSAQALEALAEAVGAKPDAAILSSSVRPDLPAGPLTPETIAAVVGAHLPEGAIVSDEAITAGIFFAGATRRRAAPRLARRFRQCHWPGPAAGYRCRHRLPGPTGDRAPSRRQRDVHDPGPLDPSSRRPERDHRPSRQFVICDLELRAEARRRRGRRP